MATFRDKIVDAVSEWEDKHIRNSPISQQTEAWNHYAGAVPKLWDILEVKLRDVTQEPAAPPANPPAQDQPV